MDPKKEECSREKSDHEGIRPVKNRIFLVIQGIGMGFEGHKPLVNRFMARLAGLHEVIRIKGRSRICLRQGVVSSMTIGAAGNTLGVTDIHDLAVIGFIVIHDRLGGKIIPFGDLDIGMAGPAAPGIGFTGRRHVPFLGEVVVRYIVESMTVRTGGRIHISPGQGPAVTHQGIAIAIVATDAILRDGDFKILP